MRVLIFANGEGGCSAAVSHLAATFDCVIAVDGGAAHCAEYGVEPDILLGDCDSIPSSLLQEYKAEGVEIVRYPEKKDATDLELALDLALERGAENVVMCGVLGGRWDMSLANILLASAEKYKSMRICLMGQDCFMQVLHPGKNYIRYGVIDETVSLIPLNEDVHGVTLAGFEYPLFMDTIEFGSTRGVSNVLRSEGAVVTHVQGVLLCVILKA